MREFVLALKAIFACWNDGAMLDFRGEFYTHTLMPPLFHPGPNPYGRPPIMLGAVGAKATEMAADVADAMLAHPSHSVASLKTITLPAVERGLQRAERAARDFFLAYQSLVVTGAHESELETFASPYPVSSDRARRIFAAYRAAAQRGRA